jgi:hypothetical protein
MISKKVLDLLKKEEARTSSKPSDLNKHKVYKPETVLRLGASLLVANSWRLGENYWDLCEEVFYASLECQAGDWTKVIYI